MSDMKMVVCGLFKLFVVLCLLPAGVAVPWVLQGSGGSQFSTTSCWFNLPLLMGRVVQPRTQGDVEAAVLGKGFICNDFNLNLPRNPCCGLTSSTEAPTALPGSLVFLIYPSA